MKKNFTFILMWLLCVFSLNMRAQTQFWSDTFEGNPSSGTRTPEVSGGTTTSYFRLTDGSTISQVVPFTGKEGGNYWAGEDHNGTGTGFLSEGKLPSDLLNELQIDWTNINIAGKTGLSFKGLLAAASTNEPWDNQNACISGVGTTNTDYIVIEYNIDGGSYTKLIQFYNRGSASGTGDKYLFEDTNNDGCGDGAQLTNVFGEFSKNIVGAGSIMNLRIRIFSEGNNEEWGIDNFRLFETICVPPVVTTNPVNRSICVGSNTTFSSIATGATTYQWQVNTGSGFTDITNGGVYSDATTNVLTITGATAGMSGNQYRCKAINDLASCFVNSNSATLSVSNIIASTAQTNIACFGASTGTASVTASGGIGSYTYSWSPSGGTGSTATGLAAGDYTCTITDEINCQITKTFTINQPAAALTAAIGGGKTDVSCYGGANGTASVAPSGGTPGYSYSWAPSGGTAATATGLAAGTYTVTVTDANSCQTTRTFTINEPAAVLTAAIGGGKTDVSCYGGSNGTATVAPSGGTPGYTYSWSPSGGTAAAATGLAAGTYTVTVTDANSCQTTRTFTINQPAAALIAGIGGGKTDVSCYGGSNGTATVAPSGGTPGYSYSWAPSGGTAATATGLAAGTYTVTVTDANSCQTTRTFTINQPAAALTAAIGGGKTDVSCYGGSNGTASVAPSGGTPGYTYSWSPSGGTAATATGLAAGTYTVTVTDANSCQTTRTFTINQPAAALTTAIGGGKTDVSCYGGANGTATVAPSGGTPGYTYSWSPSGGTAATATGLAAGTYTVTVTDANSCETTRTFTINQPAAALTAAIGGGKTDVSCYGGSNGTATVAPSGGTPGYSYSWAPSGGISATASGLTAGTYTVTVTDANSCQTTRTFTINEPSTSLSAAVGGGKTDVSCNGGTNGTATVAPSGGTPGYSYSWAPSGGTAATATGLAAGTYTVTVTDANSCETTRTFTINQPNIISFTTTTLAGYDYNSPYSQTIVAAGGTGSITYSVTTGSLPSGFNLSPNGEITGTSTQIADSNFTVTATDANNCITTHDFILKLNQIPITVTATASQTKIYGAADPILIYSVSPNLENGDTFSGALSRASGEDIGDYAINVGTLSAGSKYLMTFVGSNFAITAKPITVTADVAQTKVYGTADPVFTYSVAPSLVSGDSFTGNLTRVAGQNIGNYAIEKGSLSAGNNYDITYVSKDFAITAKPITITADASQTKVYGTADPVFTYSVVPSLVSGDSFTGNLTRVARQNIGNYAIEKGSLSVGSNYDITYISNDFAITAKPITVTADTAQTKVYGAANPVYTYTVSPSLVGSDTFAGSLTRTAGETVGTYTIGQGSLNAGSNYIISYAAKDFTITAKPITLTADASQTKVYGAADPVFTYSVSPSLIGNDTFTGSLTRAAGENVGTYAIGQGNLSAGSNYTIGYVGATFSITKADQLISWNQVLTLGCDGETTVLLTASSSSGLAVSYSSSDSNIATISNGLLVTNNYGSAIITSSQAGNANYNAAAVVELAVVNSQPNLIRKQFENIIFFDNSSKSFKSYSWYKNGVLVPGQTAQFFKEDGVLNGIYYAVATKLDGTLITSCPLILSPTVEEEYIKIVPNPVKPDATYELVTNVSSSRLQNARIEVYSIGGVLIENKTTSQNTVSLKAPTVEGIYIVKMTLANGKYFTKNILVKN